MSSVMIGISDDIMKLAGEVISLKHELMQAEKEKSKDKKRAGYLRRELRQKYRDFMKKLLEDYIKGLDSVSKTDISGFLKSGGICEAIGAALTFKTAQLRKIFHKLKTLKRDLRGDEENLTVSVAKLMPLIAYSRGRELIDEEFFSFTKELMLKIKNKQDFETFLDIFEGIVAYHKYYDTSS